MVIDGIFYFIAVCCSPPIKFCSLVLAASIMVKTVIGIIVNVVVNIGVWSCCPAKAVHKNTFFVVKNIILFYLYLFQCF